MDTLHPEPIYSALRSGNVPAAAAVTFAISPSIVVVRCVRLFAMANASGRLGGRSILFCFLLGLIAQATAADTQVMSYARCLSQQHNETAADPSTLYSPGNAAYTSVLDSYVRNRRYNETTVRKPVFIITARLESHVQAAVICTRKAGLLLKVRSGGHDYEGVSYVSDVPFVLLDMSNFRDVTVDLASETAWVRTGATLGELYYSISRHSKVHAFPAGVCPTVGAGGHITGAGYGAMIRKNGLTVDNLVDAQIVDVEGRILDRKAMGEDLFWAISGGGAASFCVVLAYKVKLVRVPETVTYFRVEQDGDEKVTNLVEAWQRVAPTTDDGLFMRLLLQPVTVQPAGETIRGTVVALFLGRAQRLLSITSGEFPQLGLQMKDCVETSWITSVLYWNNLNSSSPISTLLDRHPFSADFLKRKSDYLTRPISRPDLKKLFAKVVELGKPGLVFNPYGGIMNRIPSSAKPFPHRRGNIAKIQYSSTWKETADNAENLALIDALHEYMTPLVSTNPRRAFLNYRDLEIGSCKNGTATFDEALTYGRKYFADNFERLVRVKTQVDPRNFFRNEQSIPPCTGPTCRN